MPRAVMRAQASIMDQKRLWPMNMKAAAKAGTKMYGDWKSFMKMRPADFKGGMGRRKPRVKIIKAAMMMYS